jgi:F-type H+-transporting ATPase subunit alpha
MTALPIIETQAQNVSAYIPTNLISITDGQIYLSPELFGQGVLPAVDVGRSVSRVGGRTQLAAYREVAGDLRLSYSQFEELETFARFGTRLDEETRRSLERGRRVREVLKQPQFSPIPVPEQIAVMLAVTEGLFDSFSLERVPELKERVRKVMRENFSEISSAILDGEPLSREHRERLVSAMRKELISPQSE